MKMADHKPPESSLLQLLFHIFVVVHHSYVWWFCSTQLNTVGITDEQVLAVTKHPPLFFTNWNFVLQLIYFSLATAYDILLRLRKMKKQANTILKWKSYLYTSFIFPFGLFLPGMFWTLYNINKTFVFPDLCDTYVPRWLNHCLHSVILVVVLIEAFIVKHPPQSFKAALVGYTIIFFLYHTLISAARFLLGFWIYPIFNILTGTQLIIYMFIYYLMIVCCIVIGFKLEKFKLNLHEREYLTSQATKLRLQNVQKTS